MEKLLREEIYPLETLALDQAELDRSRRHSRPGSGSRDCGRRI